MTKAKILVIHVEENDVSIVMEKIEKLNAKSGPFDSAILMGNISSGMNTVDITAKLPPIFISGGQDPNKEGLTIMKNGIQKLPNGLKLGFFVNNDEKKLVDFKVPVDILVTSEYSVAVGMKYLKKSGDSQIDEIVKSCHPRYHFTYKDRTEFVELEPFAWDEDQRVTRFINIASFGSGKKWAYAFNIDIEVDKPLLDESMNNPYTSNYFTGKRSQEDFQPNEQPKTKKSTAEARKVLPSACHFCFTNPDIEDHMVISIASKSYVTIAKGPLSIPTGDMDFSGHCLIIPIEHIPKLNRNDDDSSNNRLQNELVSYEDSIVKMNFSKFNMSTIVFEIHSDNMVHFHKQLVPIPKFLTMKFADALGRQVHINNERFGRNKNIEFEYFESPKDQKYRTIINDPRKNYMMFSIHETLDSPPQIFIGQFEANDRIDLQFGRRTLAYLLHLPNRTNWRSPNCLQTKEQEEQEVYKFQKAYNDYDIAGVTD